MTPKVYIAADNIISPLGFTSEENFENLKNKKTGIRFFSTSDFSHEPVHAAVIDNNKIDSEFATIGDTRTYTKLEKISILSVYNALKQNPKMDVKSSDTIFIFSTTKGNIDLLERADSYNKNDLLLWNTANKVAAFFENPNKALVVSNACISGVVALITAKRFLLEGMYKHVVVVGADLISHFVVSGFQSFKAVSEQIAKPYDANRTGISLGEAAGTIILTVDKEAAKKPELLVLEGSISNDANHISGPSRTGDGLLLAIEKSLQGSGLKASQIDFISGHGTATLFNDEMESLAMNDAGLSQTPMNSLKSYFGHTLGAAGIIESVVTLESMRNNTLIATYNYETSGTSKPLNVIKDTEQKVLTHCMKTAAGFGGCNAAIVFFKNEQ